MSKVFVVQQQVRRDPNTREMVPAFDLSAAEDYGELVFIVGPDALPFRPQAVIKEMHSVLKDFTPGDYLLLVGNPCLIGWATSIAASYSEGRVKQLQWNARSQCYLTINASVFDKS